MTFVDDLYFFLLGLCVGSFMNVVIYRLPASESIVHPGSRCPGCKTPIRFYDNIPVFSWLILRGKCRHCGFRIPIRYALIEFLGGITALSVYLRFGLTLDALVYFLFITTLIVVTFIDIDHRIIPDRITLPGIPLFFMASLLMPVPTWVDALLGVVAGGGSLLLIAWGYGVLTGREGMGGGDIKLLAMIGALLGWQGVLFTIFMSSAVGTLVGVLLMLRARKGMKLAIPFGPFLSIGGIFYIFYGPALVDWYVRRMAL